MPDRVLRQTSLVRSRKNVVLLARVNIFIPITLSVRQRIAKLRAKKHLTQAILRSGRLRAFMQKLP